MFWKLSSSFLETVKFIFFIMVYNWTNNKTYRSMHLFHLYLQLAWLYIHSEWNNFDK